MNVQKLSGLYDSNTQSCSRSPIWDQPSLHLDPFLHIFEHLELRDLQNFGTVSNGCYKVSGHAFFWKKLCDKADLKIKELSPRLLILTSLNSKDSKALFACGEYFSDHKQAIDGHKYLGLAIDSIKEENALKASAQLKKAILYMNCNDTTNPYIIELFSCVLANPNASTLDKLEADYRLTLTELRSNSPTLDYTEINKRFKNVHEHENVSKDLCGRAKYTRVFQLHFRFNGRVLTDNEANQLLIEVSENESVTENIRLSADYLRAKMHMHNCILTFPLTDELVDEILMKVQQSTLSEAWKCSSNYFRALLRIESRVLTLSYEEIDHLLVKCIQSPHSDENMKTKSLTMRAHLQSDELVAKAPEVYNELLSIASIERNPKVTAQNWANAILHLANDVLQEKTEVISGEEANELLAAMVKKQILENSNISPSTLAEALAIRAGLHLQERTNVIDAPLLFAALNSNFMKLTVVSPTARGLCGFMMARLAIKYSLPKVSNSLIYNILCKVSEIAAPFVSLEAALLRIKFARERKLTSLNEEDVEEFLQSVLNNPNCPKLLKVAAEELKIAK